ncbi:kinesin-like protein KIN-10B [Durio zibethinus]|uniref:Kinesin-like protein n=1 Tax=Durio zibethinus TaxID=66656 RepID=A0A6P6ARL2_DURZI|nr:kinesin-like protein KIN-10B [Durio zibethinus]
METQSVTLCTPSKQAIVSKVRVVVRVRPFLPQEIAARNGNSKSCIFLLDQQENDNYDEVSVHLKDPNTSRNECYRLDSFFDQEDDNVRRIFYREVNSLIPGIFHGFNATVFAYGATGSGKTYTMQGTEELPGLMPLAMTTILSICQSTGCIAEVSYYEVYMDRCYDLLEVKTKEISILDDKDGQIHLRGLSRIPINSMSEFHEVFSCGIQRRKVAHTGLNDVSSRSHGVLVISVSTPPGDGSGPFLMGKLNLIDLAGNEDNRRTCNEGIRLQESAKINQSLFALSNVIYALNNNKPRVPYRESKLTRILQDSLGGTSRALMVACLNPGEYQESVHTVSLAARSRHISNAISSARKLETPKDKVDMEAKLKAWLESKGKTKSAQRMGPFASRFLSKASSAKKLNYNSSCKVKTSAKDCTSNAKHSGLSVTSRNLFNKEGVVNSYLESFHVSVEGNEGETGADFEEIMLESTMNLAEEPSSKEEDTTVKNSVDTIELSPVNERKTAMQSPLRKVLSPIHSNIIPEPLKERSSKDQFSLLYEPHTPQTPSITSATNKFQNVGTPLDKFNVWSSNLKSSLIQEYIEFLNTASREELLGLKGIGSKMTEYIIELRETSPLRSLSDLEKIGLSSKQVYNLFSKAAKGIFDRPEIATPRTSCS